MELFGNLGDFQSTVRRSLADPDRAIIVLILGLSGVYRELMRPGRVLPGLVGAVAFVLALQALLRQPLTVWGVGLVGASVCLILLQACGRLLWLPCAGAGIAALLGTRWLVGNRTVDWIPAIASAAFAAGSAVLVRYAWLAWRRKRSV